jgi:Domain of unknown function (DUF4815)
MTTITLDQYYNRFDPSKNYEQHLFRAGYVLQSAELNEVQSASIYRLKGIADALFKDGDIVRDAGIIVDQSTGAVQCQSGAIYLNGAVRGVSTANLAISVSGTVTVGVYLVTAQITETQDSGLRDPAEITRNYQEPGAGRLKVTTAWGYSGDGQSGDFYPVYEVDNGILRAKNTPPNLDSVTQLLAQYDRDSAGGSYVVSGMNVQRQADMVDGRQVYTISEGRSRVNGYGVEKPTSTRLIYAATPDLRLITNEPHTSSTTSSQRVNVALPPINNIVSVSIVAQKTVTLTHGGYIGVADSLPDTSVLSIVNVLQGGTTYANGTDYVLTSDAVDWSPGGAEPATGSSYSVTYQYYTNTTPTSIDDTGFNVSGAVVGSAILVTYNQKLPRIDRLAMAQDGSFAWFQGVSAALNPAMPAIPANMLPLATILQLWTAATTVTNDSVRVVSMTDLANYNSRFDYLLGLISQQVLVSSANTQEATQKQGIFVDPFLDDSMRDSGTTQTAAIFNGELTLAVDIDSVFSMPSDVSVPATLPFTLTPALSQTARTGSMQVNPYMAFDPISANVKLTPPVDNWTDIQTTWKSSITQRITQYAPGYHGSNLSYTTTTSSVQLLSSVSKPVENLRQIVVHFNINGFGPNETLSSVTFDGISVTPSAP